MKFVGKVCANMSFKNGSMKLAFAFCILAAIGYRKIITGATQIVNVRNSHKLQTRSLLFPPTAPTRVQFIGGIGIPIEDLSFESVTSGYVLKAEYFLPETADVFHQKIKPQAINRRRKSANETDLYEKNYKQVLLLNKYDENILNNQTRSFQQHKKYIKQKSEDSLRSQQKPGAFYRWIVYRAVETVLNKSSLNGHVCMLRSICEHAAIPLDYEGGLLAEILHIILTPSSSRDEIFRQEHKNYLRAEVLGRSGEDCAKAFSACAKSPIELISTVFEV